MAEESKDDPEAPRLQHAADLFQGACRPALKLKLRIGYAIVGAGVDCDARDRKHKPRILHACFT
jgi:hypothetical protein